MREGMNLSASAGSRAYSPLPRYGCVTFPKGGRIELEHHRLNMLIGGDARVHE